MGATGQYFFYGGTTADHPIKKTMTPPNGPRLARVQDHAYVEKLQRLFSEEVGFLSRQATCARLKQRNVLIALENSEPAGFLLGAAAISTAQHIRPIYQAVIQFDAQRKHHGLQLVELLSIAATAAKQTIIQCFCRQDLDANAFWREAGFVKVALRDVNAHRGEPCILWRKPLVRMTAETLMFLPYNVRNQTGGGRSVRRHDYHALPLIEPFCTADITAELSRLQLAA